MEETWFIELKDTDTYYNEVTVRQLLDQLAENCDGIGDTDAANILLAMPTWWNENPSVPKYILPI